MSINHLNHFSATTLRVTGVLASTPVVIGREAEYTLCGTMYGKHPFIKILFLLFQWHRVWKRKEKKNMFTASLRPTFTVVLTFHYEHQALQYNTTDIFRLVRPINCEQIFTIFYFSWQHVFLLFWWRTPAWSLIYIHTMFFSLHSHHCNVGVDNFPPWLDMYQNTSYYNWWYHFSRSFIL